MMNISTYSFAICVKNYIYQRLLTVKLSEEDKMRPVPIGFIGKLFGRIIVVSSSAENGFIYKIFFS